MNYAELQHVVQKLSFDLLHARVDQICDAPFRLQFAFRRYVDAARKFFLILDFHPSHLDLYPIDHPKKAPSQPQAFTMLLRKYLMGRALTALRLSDTDRIVTWEFGEDGEGSHALVAELTGRAPKIFFIEVETQKILGRIGRDDDRILDDLYVPPPAPARLLSSPDRFACATDFYAELERTFTARDDNESLETLRTQALRRARTAQNRASRLELSLRQDLQKARRAEDERLETDILNAYAYKVPKGASQVDLPDFQTGQPVRIFLDPALSVRENIDRRYAHCKRLIKALPGMNARLETTCARHARLDDLVRSLNDAPDFPSLQALFPLVDTLCAPFEKNIPSRAPKASKKKDNDVHIPFKTFFSADNTRILVGKTAQDNDLLTFRFSRGNDAWLHALGIPGSHVVVKSPSPSPETLLDAALLAKHYSKAAQADAADIQVTCVKFVRKIKDAPPGKVEIRGEKCLLIRKDPIRLARLLATES